MRQAQVKRTTKETDISGKIEIFPDEYFCDIDTGVGFLDHMLTLFSKHSNTGLEIKAKGDLNVDCHHTVEDTGILIGKMIDQALGDRKGIKRYGYAVIPMDEVLCEVALDLGGRPFIVFNCDIPTQKIGEYDTEVTEDFWRALAFNCGMTLHINLKYGKNAHHVVECIFKAFAHAFKSAVEISEKKDEVLSTKGTF